MAAYAAGPLARLPAVTRHAFGAGTAWYLSTLLAADDLTALLRDIATAAGLLPASDTAPPSVAVSRRHDGEDRSWLLAVNHSTAPATLRACGLDLITGREIAGPVDLPPGGVAVIRERIAGQR